MSSVVEEAVDSPAVSEEEDTQDMSQEEELPSLNTSRVKAAVVGDIIEGKRSKKTVERLDLQAPKQMEKLKIGDGSGDKLGDIPRTSFQLTKVKPADLKPLHTILFDRPGKIATIKKNLRLFNGFGFDADSEEFIKKRDKLLKNSNFTNTKLKVVCGVLDLEKKGTQIDLVDRIMTFLIAPKTSGKRLPGKKKRKSKKKLSGDNSETQTKKKSKSKPTSSLSSPKKSKAGSKSKAIVMDSSSDEEDEEEEEKGGAEAEGSDTEEKLSEKEEDQSDQSEHSADEEEEEEDDDDSSKSEMSRGKSSSKKSAPVKRKRTPAKKTSPRRRAKKSESDGDSEPEPKPKKKKPPVVKPAAKTKKADSSSSRKNNTNTADDSSEDDEPLSKMIKKSPSDAQLKETVQGLLKEANLEEMTMKQICQRVFDTFPDHDLSSKKDFIKQTVKSLIT
ncbi:protein DEK isoform X2 [Limanda limanda]|uniref:protein DEK isoform X2 n=1 Tax=Limanda limanda TaxID=27771 RepID=UPI0029C88B39|nr:protein DEK isoform X2 [Limanda limanda]